MNDGHSLLRDPECCGDLGAGEAECRCAVNGDVPSEHLVGPSPARADSADRDLQRSSRDAHDLDRCRSWRARSRTAVGGRLDASIDLHRFSLALVRIGGHPVIERRGVSEPGAFECIPHMQPVWRRFQSEISAMAGPGALAWRVHDGGSHWIVVDVGDQCSDLIASDFVVLWAAHEHRTDAVVHAIHPVGERRVHTTHPCMQWLLTCDRGEMNMVAHHDVREAPPITLVERMS